MVSAAGWGRVVRGLAPTVLFRRRVVHVKQGLTGYCPPGFFPTLHGGF